MAISINWDTKVIYVPKVDTDLIQTTPTEIRQLDLNGFRATLKTLEASELGITYLPTHNHNQPVTIGGVTLARVIEIINDYTITFEDGQYAVNLVGGNSNVGDRVNVNQVSVRSANSAGLIHMKEMEEATEATKRLIEGLRSNHSGAGNIYYWNPYDGNNFNDGRSPQSACLTFKHIHDNLVKDWNHDIVICQPGNPTGTTFTTENLEITKNYVFLRGPGRNFLIQSSNNLQDFIKVTGSGVQIEKIRIGSNTNNTKHAIWSSGDFLSINGIIVSGLNNGIEIFGGNHIEISADIQDNLGYGIKIAGGANRVAVKNSHVGDNGGVGILVDNLGGTDTIIHNENTIHGNLGGGIDITANSADVVIHTDVNTFGNTGFQIRDNGINTYIEHNDVLMDTAHAVWDEPIAEHNISGSFAEFLNKKLLTVAKFIGLK